MANNGLALLVSVTQKELEHILIAKNPVILKRSSPTQRITSLPVSLYFAVKGHHGIVAAKGQLDFVSPTLGNSAVLARTIYTQSAFQEKFLKPVSQLSPISRTYAWEISNISRIFAHVTQFTQIAASNKYQVVSNVPKGWIYVIEPRI